MTRDGALDLSQVHGVNERALAAAAGVTVLGQLRPVITRWASGPVPYEPVFEDPSLPHQIVLIARAGCLAVSCNCLQQPSGRGCPRQVIGTRKISVPWQPGEGRAAWRGWHEQQGVTV